MKTIINKITRLLLVVLMLLVSFGINNTVYADDPLTPIISTLEKGGKYLSGEKLAVSGGGAYIGSEQRLLEGEYQLTYSFDVTEQADGEEAKTIAVFLFIDLETGHPESLHVEYDQGIGDIIGIECTDGDGSSSDNHFKFIPIYKPDEVTVTINVGSNHTALVSEVLKGIRNEDPAATSSGSVITFTCAPTKLSTLCFDLWEFVALGVLGDSSVHNNETFMGVAPKSEYSSWTDFDKAIASLEKDESMVTDNQKFFLIWAKPIKSVNVISSYPEEGQKVEYEDLAEYEWPIQTPAPKMSLGANYYIPVTSDGVETTLWQQKDGNDFKGPSFKPDTTYRAFAIIKPEFGYIFPSYTQGLVVKVNEDIGDNFRAERVDPTELKVYIDLPTKPVSYKIIGSNNNYVEGSNADYELAKIVREPNDTAFYQFAEIGGKVFVDEEEVDSKHYKAEAGSLKLTLTKDYMKELKTGEHKIRVVFNDGEVTSKFSVVKPSPTPKPKYTAPKTGVE